VPIAVVGVFERHDHERGRPLLMPVRSVSLDELREAVEYLHGVPAKFIEGVEVDERFTLAPRLLEAEDGATSASAYAAYPPSSRRR
jgi:hypothetical protein